MSERYSDLHWEFHKEEYLTLREEIARHDNQRARLQYLGVFGSIIITWWIVSLSTDDFGVLVKIFMSFCPIVILFCGAWIAHAHVARGKEVGSYIKSIEKKYAANGKGWEFFLDEKRRYRARKRELEMHNPNLLRRLHAFFVRGSTVTWPTQILLISIGLIETAVLAMNLLSSHASLGP